MPIIYIIIGLAFIGFIMWLVNNKINMDPKIKTALNWIVIALIIFWGLREFHLWEALLSIRV